MEKNFLIKLGEKKRKLVSFAPLVMECDADMHLLWDFTGD